MDSLLNINTYQNIEIIIVENNSKSSEIFDYYREIQNEHNNIKVVTWTGTEFNFSAINNYGVSFAKGDYILFLNNDTEVISPDAISEMLGCCMREEVGVVGAKLLFENDTVQHAGVVVGFGGAAGHVFSGIGKNETGFMMRPLVNCNYSAVTAACMMTKKDLFEVVGGFDENIPRTLPAGHGVKINKDSYPMPPIFNYLKELGKLDEREMYNIFNMGIGMVLVLDASEAEAAIRILAARGEKASVIGKVTSEPGVNIVMR